MSTSGPHTYTQEQIYSFYHVLNTYKNKKKEYDNDEGSAGMILIT